MLERAARAGGVIFSEEVDGFTIEAEEGDVFLICSDAAAAQTWLAEQELP